MKNICAGDSLLFNGIYLKTAGIYNDTLQNSDQCDSIITLTLNVLDTSQTTLIASICQGAIYEFQGMDLTEAGLYQDTLTNENGCDSIIVLDLRVLECFDWCGGYLDVNEWPNSKRPL